MRIDLLTLFPDFFSSPLKESMIRLAVEKGKVEFHVHQIRDYAKGKHRQVDDSPFGGGAGMVMKPDPIVACLEKLPNRQGARTVYLTPQGKLFNQSTAHRFSGESHLVLLCGHYEGVDERVRSGWISEEISIGDFVLTGGEAAALVVLDAVVRLIPGVLGSGESVVEESFEGMLLEYPQYTRPRLFRGEEVPAILLSGNHAAIQQWRRKEGLRRTYLRRPELLQREDMGSELCSLLDEIIEEERHRKAHW